jgi:hypothetical protein
VRRVNLQVDGLSVDSLVAAGDSGRLVLDLSLDIRKVVEPSIGDMVKFCPFGPAGGIGVSIRVAEWIGSALIIRHIDELKDQGPTGDDAASSW